MVSQQWSRAYRSRNRWSEGIALASERALSGYVVIERLVRAVNRGIRVRIMARAPHKLKGKKLAEGVGGLRIMHDVGAKVHTLKGLKLHVIADEKVAIVGSINLSPGSFDSRRELAIETGSRRVLKRLVKVSQRDWKHSRKLDLSDDAVLDDLKKTE
jgi:cardiolipin synthase